MIKGRVVMRITNINMLSGSITKGLVSMSIPIMIVNIMNSLFNMIDMVVLRIFSNENAVGAVGACGMLITLSTSLLAGAAVGANVVVAKRIGAGDQEQTGKAVMTSLMISVVGSLGFLMIGVLFSETFLKWTNCPGELLPQAVKYLQINFYDLPFYMLYTFSTSVLRAMGDTKRPMYFMMLGGMIKALFTVLLVAGFHMDVEGVGYATLIAHLIEGILALGAVCQTKEHFCMNLKKISFDLKTFQEILQIGIPSGIHSAIFAFMNLLITAAVNSFGKDATTGIAIASQFDVILYQICYAPSLAITPYIAQNMGANNMKRVKQTVIRGVVVATAFGVVFGAVLLIFSKPLVMAMSSSQTIIDFALQKMVITSSTYFICGIQDVFGGVFRGLGKPNIPTLVTLLCVCPLRIIWVYVLFPLCSNMAFLYVGCSVEWALTSIVQFVIYFCSIVRVKKRIA